MVRVRLVALVALVACSKTYGVDADGGGATPVDPASIEISPDTIDFGEVACGSEQSSHVILTLRNKSPTDVPYKIEIPEGSTFSIREPTNGTVPARSQIVVTPVARTKAPGDEVADVAVSVGSVFETVRLSVRGAGPTLRVVPSMADLGDVRAQSGGSLDVEIRNEGSSALALTRFDGAANGFTMTWNGGTAATVVPAGKSIAGQVLVAPGPVDTSPTATFKPIIDGALCGTTPSVTATAHLVSRSVTISNVDFDIQDCGSSPTVSKDVVITNYGSVSITVIPDPLPATSMFVYASTDAVNIPPAGSAPSTGRFTLSLRPLGAKLGVATETLGFTVGGVAPPDGGTRTATSRVDVHGAVIGMTPNPLTGFTSKDCTGQPACGNQKLFVVTNTGNDTINVTYTFNRTSGPPAWTPSLPSSIAAGASINAAMLFSPQGTCALCEMKATVARVSGGALCNVAVFDYQGATN